LKCAGDAKRTKDVMADSTRLIKEFKKFDCMVAKYYSESQTNVDKVKAALEKP
jgi:hypothetical protein